MKRKIGEPKVSVKHRLRMLEGASMVMQKQIVRKTHLNQDLIKTLQIQLK